MHMKLEQYEIHYDSDPKQEEVAVLLEGIQEFNKQKAGIEKSGRYAFFVKDDDGQIIGGCSGDIWLDSIHVDLLWIGESLRSKKIGSMLMQKVEELGKEKKSHFVTVITLSTQAFGFYEKLGYKIVGAE